MRTLKIAIGRTSLATLLALIMFGLLAVAVEAKPPPGKGGGRAGKGEAPTGLIYGNTSAGFLEIVPDGSAFTEVPCGGNPSFGPIAGTGERWFVRSMAVGGDYDPFGIQRTELFVTDYGDAFPADPAACSYEQVTFLGSQDPGIHGWDSAYLHAMYPLWSPDGTKVSFLAWYGLETAPGSAFGSYDVWVADAVTETDGSISFANVHDLVSGIDGAPVLTPYNWSPDSAWFTYSRRDTTTGLYQVWVVDVSTGAEFDVSPDPGQAEWGAAFSPVLNDDGTLEVAFFRGETAASPLHYIYVAAFDPANPGNALTGIRQVTSKKTANLAQARNITWSPDAQHLGFQATGLGLADDVEIYVVKSDGKGKAKLVTGDGFPDGNAGIAAWRTDPALD